MNNLEYIAALEQDKQDLLQEIAFLDRLIERQKKRSGLGTSTLVPQISNVGANGHAAKPSVSSIDDKYRSYYSAKNNRDKAIAILKAEGKFLHIRQIVEIAQKLEPDTEPNAIKSSISQAIYGLKSLENSPLVSYSPNKSLLNVFWGSKNWLNEKGEIKPEHKYDENQISTTKKDHIEI